MRNLVIPTLTLCALAFSQSSCGKKETKTAKRSRPKQQLIIGDPITYSLDSITMFPVGLSSYAPPTNASLQNGLTTGFKTEHEGTYTVVLENTNGANSYGNISTYSNNKTDDVDIRNLVFYNRFTGENHKLTDKSLHIIAFSLHYEFKKPIIMYHVIKHDYNKDKKFNYKDPTMLYVSDLNGKNFTQLSPEKEQFMDYFFYPETNKILLKVKTDTDNNKKFDMYDQVIFREVAMSKPEMGTVLFGEKMIEDLKKLL